MPVLTRVRRRFPGVTKLRLGELLDAHLEPLDPDHHVGAHAVEHVEVQADQLEERLGRHVEAALERGEELVRLRDDGAVDAYGGALQRLRGTLSRA